MARPKAIMAEACISTSCGVEARHLFVYGMSQLAHYQHDAAEFNTSQSTHRRSAAREQCNMF